MPGFDRTGPQGQGAMTGGGRGLCRTPADQGFGGFGRGRGRGFGGRGGRGFGARQFAAGDLPADDAVALQAQVRLLQDELEQMRQRLEELQK